MAEKTTEKDLGLKKETLGALCVLLGPTLVAPVVFILIEKDEFVRFWAFQSLVVFAVVELLPLVIGLTIILAPLLIIIAPLCTISGVILWLFMTYKAWQGDRWNVPFFGNLAAKLMKKA